MTHAASEALLTADDFDRLPEPASGGRRELVGGHVVEMTTVSPEHGELQVAIASRLDAFAGQHSLGKVFVEVGYRLALGARGMADVRAPDVSFVPLAQLPPRSEQRSGSFRFAPALAVEVVSPDDLDADVARKVEDYLQAGTVRVWVVRPDTLTVTVHRPLGVAHVFHSADALSSDDAGFVTTGFHLPVSELFDDPFSD